MFGEKITNNKQKQKTGEWQKLIICNQFVLWNIIQK